MSDRSYDPDAFDWNDDVNGVSLDDLGPDIVHMAVKAAAAAHEARYGWTYTKRSQVKESAGRLFRVNYYMPKEKKEFFEENFPGYTFVWDGARGHHDHPVAHLCTELNELEMVESLVRKNEVYVDLFGNYKRNAKYHRPAVTVYDMATPKDYIRYQHIGEAGVKYNFEDLCDPSNALGKIDTICMTHSLYYLKMEQIGRLLALRPTRRLKALVHRHSGTHGFLNAGEQEYWVDDHLMVTQMNVSTGERYTHPSLEALFHQGSAKTASGGVAWTIRQGGGDTFEIEFVGCPNKICEEYTPLKFLKPESWEIHEYGGVRVKKFLHWTWMSASTGAGQVVIQDTDLFDTLRRYVAGKERTPRLRTETMNYARRLCNKNDIIAVHGGGAHEVPVASMTDYVEVALYVDAEQEFSAAVAFAKNNETVITALNSYYQQGKLPRDFTKVTGVGVKSARMFSDAAIMVMDQLRSSTVMTAQERVNLGLPDNEAAIALIGDGDPGGDVGVPWW